jgi:hypothetical protein
MSKTQPMPAVAKRFAKKTPAVDLGRTAAELIDARIAELADWRGELLARIRSVMHSADPAIVEEWKWNTPVWSSDGIICTGETYKKAVKLTFAKGASIEDPAHLFNSSLDGNTRRAIDFLEGGTVDEAALKALVRAAAALNRVTAAGKAKRPGLLNRGEI